MDEEASQETVDALIRDIIRSSRHVTAQEVAAIRSNLSNAPFNQRAVRVATNLRGLVFQGQEVANLEVSLRVHLAKRVLIDRQWTEATTAAEYLDDLRAAVEHPDSHLLLYQRYGASIAAVFGPSRVPASRRGAWWLPNMYVVYSADYGCLITGYQISSTSQLNIPGDAQWLD